MSKAQVIMADVFGKAYAALDGSVQQQVLSFIMKVQREPDSKGLNIKMPQNARDRRVRTARVNDDHRAVMMHHSERLYYLVSVLPHDDAYRLAQNIVFDINKVTGGVELMNLGGLEGTLAGAASLTSPAAETAAKQQSLFAKVSDADFERLGINPVLVPALREIRSTDAALGITEYLPKLARDVVLRLADGYTVEQVWEEVTAPAATEDDVDTADYEAAQQRPATKESFTVTGDVAELERIMHEPLSAWRVYLHPTQRKLAERKTPYNGPVRVTGGPGTGKTVVALHRVQALAAALPPGHSILFTTYNTTLAELLRTLLEDLGGASLLAKVDIRNIDKVVYGTVKEAIGTRMPTVLGDADILRRWEDLAADRDDTGLDGHWLATEWNQVVLAQDVRSRDDYFAVRRTGRGRRLSRPDRAQVWALIEEFERRLDDRGETSYAQLATQAARIASGWADEARPYRHIVVDEAQDLHPAHWKLLRALAPAGPDDMFIVGDAHQRIYDNRTSLSTYGINVRGRSHRLTLNYRTTRQILSAALGLLGNEQFDDLDEGRDTLAGYRSVLRGSNPEIAGYQSQSAELAALVKRIASWQDEGMADGEIAVVSRTNSLGEAAKAALTSAGVAAVHVKGRQAPPPGSGVHVLTMHRIKGLEYRAVAVIGAGADYVPMAAAVITEDVDREQHRNDLQRERALLFVAATRAREQLSITWTGRPSSFLPGR